MALSTCSGQMALLPSGKRPIARMLGPSSGTSIPTKQPNPNSKCDNVHDLALQPLQSHCRRKNLQLQFNDLRQRRDTYGRLFNSFRALGIGGQLWKAAEKWVAEITKPAPTKGQSGAELPRKGFS